MKLHEPHARRWRRIVAVALLGLLPLVYIVLASLFPPEYVPLPTMTPSSIGRVLQGEPSGGPRAAGDVRRSELVR